MLKFRVDDKLDKFLEFSLALAEYELQISFAVAITNSETVFLQEVKNIISGQVSFIGPVNSLEQHNRAEFLLKLVSQIKA